MNEDKFDLIVRVLDCKGVTYKGAKMHLVGGQSVEAASKILGCSRASIYQSINRVKRAHKILFEEGQ